MPRIFPQLLAAICVSAMLSTSEAAQVLPTSGEPFVPLASQDGPRFGGPIAFAASGYTPPGITSLVRRPLASQDRPQFGEAIVFVASGAQHRRQPLASQDQAGFGDPITFVASGYTPPAANVLSTIDVVVAR